MDYTIGTIQNKFEKRGAAKVEIIEHPTLACQSEHKYPHDLVLQ